jgi:hypothetical protein
MRPIRFNATRWAALGALLPGLLLAACGQSGSSGVTTAGVYADRVIQDGHLNTQSPPATPAQWPYFFQPQAVLGAPGGLLDVFSLGYDPAAAAPALGGFVIVGLGDGSGHRCAVDGPGADLAVFENPFSTTDAQSHTGTDNEVATVEVSQDALTWYLFTPADDTTLPAVETVRYANLAGVTPTSEGGDRFDLADPSIAPPLPLGFQACYVRLTDGGTLWADYGNTQTDTWNSGADIDAVQALHSVAAPGQTP